MKLNAKSASVWLAVPLLAIGIAACGDSDSTTPVVGDENPVDDPGQGALAECGDGILDVSETTEEECDDGNTTDGDMCTNACTTAVCGDSIVGPGEDCDDGDPESDSCYECRDPDCGNGILEEGEECDEAEANGNTAACTNSCDNNVCGDSLVGPGEECDLGAANGANGSACTAECDEDVCGDGHVGPSEACDDGNETDDDDCTNRCGLPGCGDGVPQEGEECDDGNTSDRDECLSSCNNAFCGDGNVQTGEEECDDGNASNADGCLNDCTPARCGDGFVQPGEGCDEGEANAADGECDVDCSPTTCGDGAVQEGEECDDGNASNTDSCLSTCVWASCGDPHVYSNVTDETNPNAVEECDDQNNSNGDTCTNACMANVCGDGFRGPTEACDLGPDNGIAGGTCTAECTSPECGNGELEEGEACDDGNDDETDSCAQCQWNSCGDGFPYVTETDAANTNPPEQCDDGDETNTNTCTNACTNAVCGDSIVGPGEGCDDGNDVAGDGCNSCAGPDCGNSVVDPGEDCDDGNTSQTDACLNSCVWNSCSDGQVYLAGSADPANPNPTEECDDANGTNLDACLNDCSANECGDGFRNPATEICDNGALNGPGGTCSLLCTPSACGNGDIDPGEECDDENVDNTDSCLSNCTWNGCGDGAVYVTVTNNSNPNSLEQCDDANTDQDDLCLNSCVYNTCGDTFLLVDFESEPYDDPDGTGPMTASRGEFDDGFASRTPVVNGGVIPAWNAGQPTEIAFGDFQEAEECENPSPTGACVSSDFDGDGINECRNAECGDGFVQAGVEQCDENKALAASTDNTDGCLDTCQLATCGDGWVKVTAPAEVCDDGNAVNTDNCVNCALPLCGDGIRQGNEACDNGAQNGTVGNTCSSVCAITTCGDGVVQAANGEQCDNTPTFPGGGDQCLNNCRWNVCGDGFTYTTTVTGSTNNQPIEECDDGNSNDRDGCVAGCRVADCGDGFVEFGVDECDDGNSVDNDECTNACNEPGCGDGILQTGEACDDGGTCVGGVFAGQGCDDATDCPTGNYQACERHCTNGAGVCDADVDCTVTDATCDDTCTGGDNSGDRCDADADCPITIECLNVCNEVTGTGIACLSDLDCNFYGAADVVIQGACANGFCREECASDADCSGGSTCITTTGACDSGAGATCTSDASCTQFATCDDTLMKCSNTEANCTVGGEPVCDVAGTCSTGGAFGGFECGAFNGVDCNPNVQCPGSTCTGGTCAGGPRAGETCNDDAMCSVDDSCQAQNADGCQNTDPPPASTGLTEAMCSLSTCGDKILDADEGCEVADNDTILIHGGGSLAAGTTCNVATCTLSTCGANAGTQTGEQCDDGNASNTDGCTNRCRSARCGDGVVQTGEQCDDGNADETDTCTNVCLWNVCGDGVRFAGTPTAQTGPQQLCDTGALVANGAVTTFSYSRGRDDGDGYDDQPAFCNSSCEVVCDGTASESAQLWKSGNTSCLMAGEAYSLAPYAAGATESYLDDGTYAEFTMDWDDAAEYCENLGIGATLVKFDAAADRDTAISVGDTVLGFDQWWVGADDAYPTDTATPNTYVWLDGTSASALFAGGQPSNTAGGDCAASDADLTPDGALNDLDCDTSLPFFCQYIGPFPRGAL